VRAFTPPSVQARNTAVNEVFQLMRDEDLRGLVRVLEDTSVDGNIKGFAARALGNLALAYDNIKVAIVAAGAIPPLLELLRGGSDEGRAGVAWALANLTINDAANKVAIVLSGAIPLLTEVLHGGSDEGRAGAAIALGNLASASNTNKVAIAAAGAIPLSAGGAAARRLFEEQGARCGGCSCSGDAEPRCWWRHHEDNYCGGGRDPTAGGAAAQRVRRGQGEGRSGAGERRSR
jgi:hypothetical protein